MDMNAIYACLFTTLFFAFDAACRADVIRIESSDIQIQVEEPSC